MNTSLFIFHSTHHVLSLPAPLYLLFRTYLFCFIFRSALILFYLFIVLHLFFLFSYLLLCTLPILVYRTLYLHLVISAYVSGYLSIYNSFSAPCIIFDSTSASFVMHLVILFIAPHLLYLSLDLHIFSLVIALHISYSYFLHLVFA